MPSQQTYPGKHPDLKVAHFTPNERVIIDNFAKHWYVTNGGSIIRLGKTSEYKYILIKPSETTKELFGIERELIVVFSDYQSFEPRTLDAFDHIYENVQELRIEKTCAFVISSDESIESRIVDLLKNDPELKVIIPLTYSELTSKIDNNFFQNRMRKYFFCRDLFDLKSPLKKDLYFYGRTDIIHKLIDRHWQGENSGLFGLRKTGKTSIIFGIKRLLSREKAFCCFIDCQSPGFNQKSWDKCLYYIISEIKNQNNLAIKVHDEAEYILDKASILFEKDIIKIVNKIGSPVLLIFDEVEHITPDIATAKHWKTGNDFILFWQTLRSIYQKHINAYTYLLVGTNPKLVEIATINGIDNPIYNQIPKTYIPSFDIAQTTEMVSKIGRIMGLKFDEIVFSKLVEDYGGHPFLIRQVCSHIHKKVQAHRPQIIDKTKYQKLCKEFDAANDDYIDLILGVLYTHYNDEYEMLTYLAAEDYQKFNEMSSYSNEFTKHLLGYNIVSYNEEEYGFNIDSIKRYLQRKNKYSKINLTLEDKLAEVSERRNKIELKLRKLIRNTLKINYKEREAIDRVLKVLEGETNDPILSNSLKDLFDGNKTKIFFNHLRKIVVRDWPNFANIFGGNQQEFEKLMQTINKYRADAHAKSISDEEMIEFRNAITKLEKYVDEFD